MPCFFELFRRRIASSDPIGRVMRALLLGLWGLASTAWAGPGPQARAQAQRRLRAVRFDRRYWDARNDSLRQVLAGQRADSQRLQTLTHLFNLTDLSQQTLPELYREHREALRLATRLGYAEREPWRLVVAFDELALAPVPRLPTMRDTLLAALRAADALGGGPQPYLLEWLEATNGQLEQSEANRRFFAQRLAHELQQGNVMNAAICYRMLGRYYGARGDYNQAISQRLRAAELFRACSNFRYFNELGAIGMAYTEWGNYARALPYLQKALTIPGTPPAAFYRMMNRIIAQAYLQLGNHPQALRYNTQAQLLREAAPPLPPYERALGLVQQSAILLALGRPAAVRQLLLEAQRLTDSLRIPLHTYSGNYELLATWARYYAAVGDAPQALKNWQAALRQAKQEGQSALRLNYLHSLAAAYQQQGQAARAATYGLAALALADTLEAAQVATRVARYEFEQDDHAQQVRIDRLRQDQQRTTAQVRQQRGQLGGLLAGLAGLVGLAVLLWRTLRRQRRDNVRLAAQQLQLEAQAERLGELDAAKNQFFANASHELRTPLTLVLGPLETLLDDPAQPLPAAARGVVARALRQARRLAELVNRILDLTKLQAGRLGVHPAPTAVAPLLRRVVGQFAPLAATHGIALHGPAFLPEELRLLVDADKVDQILTNLLSNALKHTPTGGTVALEAALPDTSGHYVLTVRDTGPGIAPAEQERVFERFYQSPQNQAQGGTGLGLALSRELAALLDGTLTLASAPGQGAAFTLRFPAVEVETEGEVEPSLEVQREELRIEPAEAGFEEALALARSAPAGALSISSLTKPRVLVVEDEPDLREYLHELLAPTCEVLTAPDGQAALELLSREAPVDLITTDAMMPRLSGTELIARLKADPARANLPVLMLTARADEAHRRAALTVGVDDYLTKPFAPAELLARVQVLLERHAVRRHFAAQPNEAPDELTAALAAPEVPAAAPPAGQLAQWQEQVVEHLANEQFGPFELARLLAMSERTLYRRLGELAGLTPAVWLRELRLDQARQLLEAGDFDSVAAVADAVGFTSARQLSQLYNERFGRRPHDYRTTYEERPPQPSSGVRPKTKRTPADRKKE